MSSQEQSLNYLIGNFVKVNTSEQSMKETNMISVDTSNGFLGFNTIDPSYHIDVVGGTIKTDNLILNNIPTIDNSAGLPLNGIYYDASGFLKIKLT